METVSINLVIKNAPTPIAIVDTKLNFISYSDEWSTTFTIDQKNLVGKGLFEIIPKTCVVFARAIESCLKGVENINKGEKFNLSNDETKWLKWKISPWKNSESVLTGLIIFLEDITEEKRELELLHKAESVAKIGSWEVDLSKNKVYWTKTTRDIHEVEDDFAPDLEEGINFFKKGPHREKITELVSLAIEKGKPWDTEAIIVTAKGNEVWVRAQGEVEIFNKKVRRLFGTLQDIDKRKKADFEYKRISERLKLAKRTAKIGIWEYDVENNQVLWDSNMYALYGIHKKNFSGVYDAWKSCIHPGDQKKRNTEMQKAISGEKHFDTEFRVLWPNGQVKHIRAIAKTIKNSSGKTTKLIGANWDITELKRTQIKLERNKSSFVKTFDHSIVGMAMVDLDGKFIKVNKSLSKSLGYSSKELEKLTFQELTHKKDLPKDLESLNKILHQKHESYQLEKRFIHKNGNFVYVILTSTVVKDLDRNPIYIIKQILDITDKKEAEIKFRESAERLNVATRVAKIGIWDYHLKDNRVECNDNMYSIYDLPKTSITVLDEWLQRIHPLDIDDVKKALELTILNKSPFNINFRGIKPNGRQLHLAAFGEAQVNKEGEVEKIIGAILDITELRRTELKLERNIEIFTETFDNTAMGMALVGTDYRWLKVNKSLSRSLGYSEEELLQIKTTDLTHPDDLEKSHSLHLSTFDGKKETYQIEQRYFHKDGHLVHGILGVTSVKDLYGKPTHTITQFLDITERIEAEKKLKTLVAVTKSQNDSLLNFAHIVSHNLRSHSTNLTMLANFLVKEKDEKERKNINTMITNAVQSLSETISHLNDVVQVKTGALQNLKSVSVLNTILNIQKSIGGVLEEQGAQLNIGVSKLHFVNAVPAYLESIFLNILTNAIKYRKAERSPVIDIKSVSKEKTILLQFSDNGQGIDLKRHGNKIFGMYKTFHKHKDAKGIGLFITKNQIEAMEGSIKIESTVNEGTTVFIELKKG
ncbi:PAS domain S-box protein [Maribacter sp. X9]|uniref:PAS domain S-box protein n=1 Tax=Maribacter sp. X9 TaxID=3402159 RepID=UPI003AF3B0AA